MSSELNLYAEFLLNIRQVTLFATLQNTRNDDSNAYITSDKKSLTITHDDKQATITFPSGISGKATVHFPVGRKKEVSLRLEVIEDDKPSLGHGLEVANDSPWPATSLSPETEVACKSCRSVVVSSRPRVWKDLPREDWAEMMDFWHCHKPDVKETPGQTSSVKGYAAMNKLKVQPGVGFVDTCHIVLPMEECSCIRQSKNSNVECTACGAILGVLDESFEGIRLYKWGLALRRQQDSLWEQNPVQNFVCAQLLALIESQAARKFVVYSGNLATTSTGILLWVLTPDLKYCASNISGGRPRRAMKILFDEIENPRDILEKSDMHAEELCLPISVLQELQEDLNKSNEVIPDPAKILQKWRVGLLDRFENVEPRNSVISDTLAAPGLTS